MDTVFDAMAAAFARGDGVEIRGFGSFVMRDYDSYQGRNPKTGDPIVVPPKRVPFFKAGKDMRRLVDANRHVPLEADGDGEEGDEGEGELPEAEG